MKLNRRLAVHCVGKRQTSQRWLDWRVVQQTVQFVGEKPESRDQEIEEKSNNLSTRRARDDLAVVVKLERSPAVSSLFRWETWNRWWGYWKEAQQFRRMSIIYGRDLAALMKLERSLAISLPPRWEIWKRWWENWAEIKQLRNLKKTSTTYPPSTGRPNSIMSHLFSILYTGSQLK